MGGFIVAIYTRIHRLSFWELADVLAPAIILGQAIGRIACFLNGDALVLRLVQTLGLFTLQEQWHSMFMVRPLWPAEVWEGQWDLIVFAVLLILRTRTLPRGVLFLSYNILYAVGRFMLEFLRGDSLATY